MNSPTQEAIIAAPKPLTELGDRVKALATTSQQTLSQEFGQPVRVILLALPESLLDKSAEKTPTVTGTFVCIGTDDSKFVVKQLKNLIETIEFSEKL